MAALSRWHEQHAPAAEAVAGVRALPSHVALEAYSVLTRLPGGLAVPGPLAAAVLAERFDEPVLGLTARDRAGLVGRLTRAGVLGGAAYDGLVALEAHAHGRTLTTLDRRAQGTYQRLGVVSELIAG